MDWSNKIPLYDTQFSTTTDCDVQDCVAESFCHIFYMVHGVRISPRALAVMSHLEIPANRNCGHVLATANSCGVVLYENCPTPDSFTMDSYYQPLTPQESLAMPIQAKLVPSNLDTSPLWTELQWGVASAGVIPERHMVAQINGSQYFDSEPNGIIKPLNYEGATIQWQSSLIINFMIDIRTVKYADGKTMGIMISSPNGTQIINATSEEVWRSWNLPTSYGKPTVNADGTTNWNADLTLNF